MLKHMHEEEWFYKTFKFVADLFWHFFYQKDFSELSALEKQKYFAILRII